MLSSQSQAKVDHSGYFWRTFHEILYQELESSAEDRDQISVQDINQIKNGWGDSWSLAIARNEPEKLQKRLEWDNIDVPTLENLFKGLEQKSYIDSSEINQWQDSLAELQDDLRNNWDTPLFSSQESEDTPKMPFIDLWLPFTNLKVKRLQRAIEAKNYTRRVGRSTFEKLSQLLISNLVEISQQPLWELYQNNRPTGIGFVASLVDDSNILNEIPKRDYYQSFIFNLRRDGISTFLRTFPLLARFIGMSICFWQTYCLEIVDRISNDSRILSSIFGVHEEASLSDIKLQLGDPHSDGKSVSLLTFSNENSNWRIVYKPKCLKLDLAYHRLIKQISSLGGLPQLLSLNVYSSELYGYMEYLPHITCQSHEELTNFYQNAGRLSAILYALGCTDCHYDNLIANETQLVLIDAETLFAYTSSFHQSEPFNSSGDDRNVTTIAKIQDSILLSGILSLWVPASNGETIDISALAVQCPKEHISKKSGWLFINTDYMSKGMIKQPAAKPKSLPIRIGTKNPISEYVDPFCDGFKQQLNVIKQTRHLWLEPNGFLELFEFAYRRVLTRHTRVYLSVKHKMLSPAALRSPFTFALVLENLSRAYLQANDRPINWKVFISEIIQLGRLDIPFFLQSTTNLDLQVGESLGVIRGFTRIDSLQSTRLFLLHLTADEINFQDRLIRGLIKANSIKTHTVTTTKSKPPLHTDDVTDSEISSIATQQFDVLKEISLFDAKGNIDWLGIQAGSYFNDRFRFGLVGPSLYDGSSGVALLEILLREFSSGSSLAEAIFLPLQHLADSSQSSRTRWWRDQPLGMAGSGGILLVLNILTKIGFTSDFISPEFIINSLLNALNYDYLLSDEKLDIFAGVAGLVGPLQHINHPRSMEISTIIGNYLLSKQHSCGGWPIQIGNKDKEVLLGFAHGSAGIAAAMARLGVSLSDDRLSDASFKAITYERSFFRHSHNNWPDLSFKSSINDFRYMNAWCHGGPGIGLGRICLYGTNIWDSDIRSEILQSISELLDTKLPPSDHLCCGVMGLTMILDALSTYCTNDGNHSVSSLTRQKSRRLINQSLSRYKTNNQLFLTYGTSDSDFILPGFFNGISGISLALLNHLEPNHNLFQLLSAGLWPLTL